MSPKQAKKKAARRTPPGLKKFLIGLLIVCAIAGYAGGTYLALHPRSDMQSAVTKKLEQLPVNKWADPSLLDAILPERFKQTKTTTFENVRDLFRTGTEKRHVFVPLTFQGTLAGENGAIAIINNKPIAVGTEIQGVQVMAISNQVLILEYKGETKKLGVGETVSVRMN